jgi:hypothetical protein
MAQKRIVKRKPSPKSDRRFTNIESKLQTIEDQIEYKFQVMEDQMESKFQAAIENNMNHFDHHFDRIHSNLEQIKKNNTKSKRVSRKRKGKKDDVHSVETKDGTGEDVGSQFADLLQNPMIQSLLSLDLSRMGDLLQNPRIQSLFANSKDNKNDKSRNKGEKGNNFSGSSGLDLSWIGNLLQNPMVQSLLKSQMNKKMIG